MSQQATQKASQEAAELLNRILGELIEMSDRVQIAMADATEALLKADVSLAEEVISADATIDGLNSQIELKATEVLTYQDLTPNQVQLAVGAIRISASLERMGDLASHVAKQTRLKFPHHSIPISLQPEFLKMGQIAVQIVDRASTAISEPITVNFDAIKAEDSVMNDLHRNLFSIVLSPKWKHGVESAIDVTLLSRYYERFGDHATSVASRINNLVVAGVFDLPSTANSGGLTR